MFIKATFITCIILAYSFQAFAVGLFKLIATLCAHGLFLEIKNLIKLGRVEYENYMHDVVQGGVGFHITKWELITKLAIWLIFMVSNFQTAFFGFFAAEFFEFYRIYETPTNMVVIPEKFPEDFCETDDVCPICTESPEILVLGCRHVMCGDCLNMLPAKNCPKCRHPIDMALVKQRPVKN